MKSGIIWSVRKDSLDRFSRLTIYWTILRRYSALTFKISSFVMPTSRGEGVWNQGPSSMSKIH
ncbi:hypothetical protein BDV33DRAFT_163559 [Aspergillus novoparasiticus]|uniref:Uncharacterized protein n=1 Tax=Aspergillus novoparasiticus TaxID=986946 RepID=A0A5N6F6E8_9EURO|nr:hypothetical protein BDV33DRAFT_163559 [Aspergillus novoparasiticus]